MDRHKELALAELKNFEAAGVVVHRIYDGSDGWLSGEKVVHAIAELPSDEIIKMRWHKGAEKFFQQSISGGSFPITVADLGAKMAIVVTEMGSMEIPTSNLSEKMKELGFVEHGICSHSNPFLNGHPQFSGLMGPMKDGERLRYEDAETNRILSM